jgi:2-dehydro-3-deoxy-D-arabinonate dehydratase
MKYYRLVTESGASRLCVEVQDDRLADLTAIDGSVTGVEALAQAASAAGTDIDEVTDTILQSSRGDDFPLSDITRESSYGIGEERLGMPIVPPEIWAAGVTYRTSEMERRRESDTPDIYSKVYSAERPELFLKATPQRCVGPFEPVGIRADSTWNVPEPELSFVLYGGEILGYTIGNDMSSRSIEGENPLYLPQAKVYDRCCAIGPCFVSALELEDPYDLEIECVITRAGAAVFRGETSTSQMARTCEELADWLQRHNVVADMTTVLTGTPVVPPPDFTLQEGDVVRITIEGIGALENDVVVV